MGARSVFTCRQTRKCVEMSDSSSQEELKRSEAKWVLGYWAIRGLGQPIRLVLEAGGFDYDEKRYVQGPAPEFDKSTWLNEKEDLGFDFPNLPYLIDRSGSSELRLTQTRVILEHLASKVSLTGTTQVERLRIGQVWEASMDMRRPYNVACYSPNFEDIRVDLVEKTLPSHLRRFSQYLGEEQWFGKGAAPSWVDFVMFDLLDQFLSLDSRLVNGYKNLADFHARVGGLPSILNYRERESFIDRPFHNRRAKFGGLS